MGRDGGGCGGNGQAATQPLLLSRKQFPRSSVMSTLTTASSASTATATSSTATLVNNNNDFNDIAAVDERKSLKRQKKEYKDEKKRVAKELVSALRDPTVVVMADWLKIRSTLRKWSRCFCVLKPGLMIIYKTNKTTKHGHWVGTILLNTCELIERPSKKDGFCFKLYQPLDQSIWATRGPLGESHGAVMAQFLPNTHLICRAPSDQAGRCWMDALELSLRCTGLLMRTMHKLDETKQVEEDLATDASCNGDKAQQDNDSDIEANGGGEVHPNGLIVNDLEAERHFDGLDDQDQEQEVPQSDGSDSAENCEESTWIESEKEVFPQSGDGSQTEEVAEENKSLLWTLLKQVRPGMDLSKVVLPTFILEPRSFLEKLADYYYHADLLAEAANEPDPFQRMVKVTKFYLSGFYKKPKGLKKPYNPILGETFRCSWKHPDGSTTYYIAEQVSHHPPISSLFITNRKAGYNIAGTILAKSKYYGNSLSAIMVGQLKVNLLNRGETYIVTLPYANCKGIMIGTMTMELGGQVTIDCENTAYSTTLDFQLKPMFGGSMNKVSGVIKYGREPLAELEGRWDSLIKIKNVKEGTKSELWNPTNEVIKTRLQRQEISFDEQDPFESKKLWSKVTAAIVAEDQYKATEEKTVLEEEQRGRAKSGIPHKTKYFRQKGNEFEYIHAEYRPWDPHNDVKQIEHNYVVKTICKLKASTKRKKANSLSDNQSAYSTESDEEREVKRKVKSLNIKADAVEELIKNIQEVGQRTETSIRQLEGQIDRIAARQALPSTQKMILVFATFTILHTVILAFLLRK